MALSSRDLCMGGHRGWEDLRRLSRERSRGLWGEEEDKEEGEKEQEEKHLFLI